jgi:hypothetical protein
MNLENLININVYKFNTELHNMAKIIKQLKVLQPPPYTGSSAEYFSTLQNGGDTFLRNVGSHMLYKAPYPRRRHPS